MQALLANPAFQSAVAPLLCSFILALLLRKAGVAWQGLAIVAGLLTTILLTTGLSFSPLTSTRKIILCSLVLPFAALLVERVSRHRLVVAITLGVLLALAALWVVWPAMARQEGMEFWLTGARVALYAAAIGAGLMWVGNGIQAREGGSVLALAIGTGAAAMLAASALYAQLAFAVAAAMGGLLLVTLLGRGEAGLGRLSLFAAALPLGLLGSAATVYAQLPALALLSLVWVPWFTLIPLPQAANHWLRAAQTTLMAMVPAIPAVWLAWQSAGAIAY
jgi:hypothetical protein